MAFFSTETVDGRMTVFNVNHVTRMEVFKVGKPDVYCTVFFPDGEKPLSLRGKDAQRFLSMITAKPKPAAAAQKNS